MNEDNNEWKEFGEQQPRQETRIVAGLHFNDGHKIFIKGLYCFDRNSMSNGNFGHVIVGPERFQYFVTKNDTWRLPTDFE